MTGLPLLNKEWYVRLLFLGLCLPFSSHSQLLENRHSDVWLRPLEDTATTLMHYIGNYPVLDTSDAQYGQGLSRIAREHSGTLFLVLRPKEKELSEEVLVRLGPVKIYKSRIEVDGQELSIPSIDSLPAMVTVKYQGRISPWYRRGRVEVSDEVELGEVVYYHDVLPKEKVRMVESYLAMKYSINITEHHKKEWRYYVDIHDRRAWSSVMDGRYDKEVMALGRLDRIGFYQSQSYSSDARRTRLSVDTTSVLGEMPSATMGDSSLVILSRSKKQKLPGRTSGCEEAVFSHIWKLKFIGWHSPAQYLYLDVDTLLDSISGAILTDGQHSYPLDIQAEHQSTRIRIPLPPDSLLENDFYLEWREQPQRQDCPPLVQVEKKDCSGEQRGHRVELKVEEDLLPCRMTLTNRRSGQSWSSMLKSSEGMLEHIGAGQYHLVIEKEGSLLKDEVFVFSACPKEKHLDADSAGTMAAGEKEATEWQFTDLTETVQTPEEGELTPGEDNTQTMDEGLNAAGITSTGITAYPNPGVRDQKVRFRFSNMEGQNFRVIIFDSKGQFMEEGEFTPEKGQNIYRHTFKVDGSYIVKFISEDYHLTQNIRIKSNL